MKNKCQTSLVVFFAALIASWSTIAGAARRAPDFNGDGYADLAVGVPGETIAGHDDAGAVQVLYGSSTGLVTTKNQLWSQNSTGIVGGSEAGDVFGAGLYGRVP